MKSTLLSLSLLIMSTLHLSAQCTSYPYFLDITGFGGGCSGGSDGQICFVTNTDWWQPIPPNPCEPYVIEISYPTPNFIVTNLGDFDMHSFSQSTTVLRFDPDFVIGFNIVGCLEGVLQIPNTTFTLQIVNPNNPNDILGTPQTFTLDNFVSIGIDNQQTNLSDWIQPNGPLLPGPIVQTGQQVEVHGTIYVDEVFYGFSQSSGSSYNELIMMPGARFEIPSGNTLSIWSANIHGCDGAQWDRINVQNGGNLELLFSEVKDASVAVELQDGATLKMQEMDFIKNNIGIGSFGPSLKSINLIAYSDPDHQSRFSDGNEGMHLENVSLVNLSSWFNFINMAASGIYFDHTDLIGQFLDFFDCQTVVNVATQNALLSLNQCNFTGGGTGIHCAGSSEMTITDNRFASLDYGIQRSSALPGEHSLVQNNLMVLCRTDIFGSVQSSSAEIQFNDLTANSINVGIWGLGFGDHKWAIQHNDKLDISIQGGLKSSNVRLNNANNVRIYRNLDVNSYFSNFAIGGGENNKLGENKAIAKQSSTSIVSSPMLEIYCNELASPSALNFFNTCTGSKIRANKMSGLGYNLLYGSAFNTYAATSEQELMGNQFDATSSAKAINYSDQTTALGSKYTVGYFNTQGNSHFPYFISNYDD